MLAFHSSLTCAVLTSESSSTWLAEIAASWTASLFTETSCRCSWLCSGYVVPLAANDIGGSGMLCERTRSGKQENRVTFQNFDYSESRHDSLFHLYPSIDASHPIKTRKRQRRQSSYREKHARNLPRRRRVDVIEGRVVPCLKRDKPRRRRAQRSYPSSIAASRIISWHMLRRDRQRPVLDVCGE